jgi:polyhydroxyalkanoate synthesis regulator phasin
MQEVVKNVQETVKNFAFTGVSVVAYAIDKVRELVENLVNEEKISAEEGKRILEEFVQNTQVKKDEFEAQLKVVSDKLIATVKPSGNSTALTDLEARIEALEAKQPAKKTTVKKSVEA